MLQAFRVEEEEKVGNEYRSAIGVNAAINAQSEGLKGSQFGDRVEHRW